MRIISRKINPVIIFLAGIGIALIYLTGYIGNGEYFNNHTAFGYDGGGIIGGGGGGGGGSVPLTVVNSYNVPLTISPDQTGNLVVNLTNGVKTELLVPRGAVTAPTTFESSQSTATAKPSSGTVLGDLISISAKGVANNPIKSFAMNLTVTLTIPSLTDTTNVGIYYLDEIANKWTKIANPTFDLTNHKISFNINHLTLFAAVRIANLPDTINSTGTTVAAPSTPSESGSIAEGALIRAKGDIDVFIVKYMGDKKFKRLILSPSVFNSYGHLKWSDVKDIDQSIVDSFATSDLVRAVNDLKVYKMYPAGDTGQKRWIETAAAFTGLGFDWDAIYEINQVDRDSYQTGASLK